MNLENISSKADAAHLPGAVEVRSVNKSYGSHVVLDDVSARFERRQVTTLLGRSGSGKSTLLRAMAGLTQIDSGSILVDGDVVARDSDWTDRWQQQRRKIGMVFQSYTLWPHLSVEKNLTLAPRKVLKMHGDELQTRARAALESVGMSRYLGSMPEHLSCGQRQRVAIARALMMSPEVLLCDEITSALDPPVAADVLAVLLDLRDNNDLCVVLVTHDMAFAARAADRLIFFTGGTLRDYSSFQEAKVDGTNVELQEFLSAVAVQ